MRGQLGTCASDELTEADGGASQQPQASTDHPSHQKSPGQARRDQAVGVGRQATGHPPRPQRPDS